MSDDSPQPASSPSCLPAPTVRSRRAPEAGPLPRAIGRFQVLERIGAGAMGVVYKCRQPGLDRPVAVKVLLAAQHAAAEDLHRFQREARAAARLSHPNIVQIYDVGTDGELPYFVMEYVDGCALDQLIGTPVLTLVNALRVLAPVARALQAAHEQGIVHRDLKPSNILIHHSGQPKLADFGLARSLQDSQVLSGSGDLVGTPRYMAPEQVLGEPGAVDARADVYALGVLLYELVAGRPPVDGPTPLAVFRQLLDGEPPDLRAACPGVPEEIAAVCRRAMARDKEARFASAAEFAEALEGYLLRHVLGKGEAADLPRARAMLAALPPLVLPAARRRGGWRARAALAAVAAGILVLVGLDVLRAALGRPAPSPPSPAAEVDDLPAMRARVVAKAREQLRGPLALPANATPRDVLRGLLEDLTAVLKRAPEDDEVRLLHARAERRAGEDLAAADDLTLILHRRPDNLDAAAERLLAEYEFYVLYFGNLDEPALRPPCLEHLRPDLEALRRHGGKADRSLADLVEALARRDYAAAARLASAEPPPRVSPADWSMLTADALFHAAGQAFDDESAAEEGKAKAKKRHVRENLVRQALHALRQGQDLDRDHVGLLFLKADSFHRRATWEATESEPRDAVMRRFRPAFEAAFDHLRRAALRTGCDTPVARAVLLHNYGRIDPALDQIEDAFSSRPLLPLYPFRAWLRMQAPPDGTLTAEGAESILRELQPAFEEPPEDFSPYFVRAVAEAAAGRWDDARRDLRQCRHLLGKEELPTNLPNAAAWCAQADGPTAEYLYATRDLLDALPVPVDLRQRAAQEVLQRLTDPAAVAQDKLSPDRARDLKAWAHFRLAQGLAQKEDKAGVLREAGEALALRAPGLTPKTFRDDGNFASWNEDAAFKELYKKYE